MNKSLYNTLCISSMEFVDRLWKSDNMINDLSYEQMRELVRLNEEEKHKAADATDFNLIRIYAVLDKYKRTDVERRQSFLCERINVFLHISIY